MDLGLGGKIALITGGSEGIGAATARLLAAEGARIAVGARSVEGLQRIQREIREETGAEILTVSADIGLPEGGSRMVQETVSHFGGLDILVNSAGASMFGTFDAVPDERWVSDINVKLVGTVRTCRAAIPHLRRRGGGRIIVVAGNSGKQPYMWHYPGGASNAALLNFTHALAQEMCKCGVLVTAVCPGPVETQRLRKQIQAMADLWKTPLEEAEKKFYAGLPLGRAATAEEVANVIVFLASPKASYVSGASLNVDGCITQGI